MKAPLSLFDFDFDKAVYNVVAGKVIVNAIAASP
jgi:hypothetical protein